MTTNTRHKEDCAMSFGRKDSSCPRCQELINGATPRKAWNSRKIEEINKQLIAIRNHDCKKSKCGYVCTFGDW